MKRTVALLALLVVIVGCAPSGGGEATAEDKKNLDNMLKNGIGTGGAPGTKPPAAGNKTPGQKGEPVGGAVAPP